MTVRRNIRPVRLTRQFSNIGHLPMVPHSPCQHRIARFYPSCYPGLPRSLSGTPDSILSANRIVTALGDARPEERMCDAAAIRNIMSLLDTSLPSVSLKSWVN